ncbi:MAG: hypothetical protein AAB420_04110 [Patescibacteria group bacterium]
MNRLRLIYSSSWAASKAILFATIITIWAELNAPLKAWLKSVTGHHWTTKSWFTIGIYVVLLLLIYVLKREPGDMQVKNSIKWLIVIAILGALALFLFFTGHYLVV